MNNVHPIFQDIMKPFLGTGLTTEQRIRISEQIGAVATANTAILEIISEMENETKALQLIKHTQAIESGASGLLMLIK